MAIKKTTAVKKSDPPKKKKSGPPASVPRQRKVDSFYEDSKTGKRTYYESGREMLPLKKPGLTKEQKQGMFNVSLITGSKNPLTAKMIEKRKANFYGTAKKKK